MATHYLYGTIVTSEAVAANNRADNIGNTTTLQKVFLHDDLHTSVSAEAIRFALRYRFQLEGLSTNRTYEDEKLRYEDEKRTYFDAKGKALIDDDLMGFMDAEAAQKEREDEEGDSGGDEGETEAKAKGKAKEKGKKEKAKGKTTKRPSPLAVGRAVSLRPYRGELSFNCVSGTKEKGSLSLYNAEIHTTEYQYSFGLNLGSVIHKEHIGHLLEAVADPPPVAGNHARFAYDFSPASIVLRLTNAHSSRIQNCFEHDEKTRGITTRRLLDRVRSGDIPGSEVILGGEIARSPLGAELRAAGVTVVDGVNAAVREAKARIARIGAEYTAVKAKGDG
ncbi:MAG TPA: DevR family CRISPR-associated autoregulator [Labilithrix sp.]|nr:DevR family CRISPR-associated autoregulator [Labilithrix sp.]